LGIPGKRPKKKWPEKPSREKKEGLQWWKKKEGKITCQLALHLLEKREILAVTNSNRKVNSMEGNGCEMI